MAYGIVSETGDQDVSPIEKRSWMFHVLFVCVAGATSSTPKNLCTLRSFLAGPYDIAVCIACLLNYNQLYGSAVDASRSLESPNMS